jgi:hypothetical protein
MRSFTEVVLRSFVQRLTRQHLLFSAAPSQLPSAIRIDMSGLDRRSPWASGRIRRRSRIRTTLLMFQFRQPVDLEAANRARSRITNAEIRPSIAQLETELDQLRSSNSTQQICCARHRCCPTISAEGWPRTAQPRTSATAAQQFAGVHTIARWSPHV